MLDCPGGIACWDNAPTMAAPGAIISGFCKPVTVGPALENQHGSPSVGCRSRPAGSGAPPTASSKGTARPTGTWSMLCHAFLLIVQPTPMMDGCVAGKAIVPSRTPWAKLALTASPSPCRYKSAVPDPDRVINYAPPRQLPPQPTTA